MLDEQTKVSIQFRQGVLLLLVLSVKIGLQLLKIDDQRRRVHRR